MKTIISKIWVYTSLALINFTVFALDMEYDRDVNTWFWGLQSAFFFYLAIKQGKKYDKEKSKEKLGYIEI